MLDHLIASVPVFGYLGHVAGELPAIAVWRQNQTETLEPSSRTQPVGRPRIVRH